MILRGIITVSISTCIAVLDPKLINTCMEDDSPMMQKINSVIVFKFPSNVYNFTIGNLILIQNTRSFCFLKTNPEVLSLVSDENHCSGFWCD